MSDQHKLFFKNNLPNTDDFTNMTKKKYYCLIKSYKLKIILSYYQL